MIGNLFSLLLRKDGNHVNRHRASVLFQNPLIYYHCYYLVCGVFV